MSVDPNPAIVTWLRSGDRGVSSNAIAGFMLHGATGALLACRRVDSPRDTSDAGRCVRLLDIAERAGLGWRGRMRELCDAFPIQWGPLRHHWPRIEAAYRRDVMDQDAARDRDYRDRWCKRQGVGTLARPRNIPPLRLPPSETWWLLSMCREGRPPLRDYPGEDGGGLWRPLDDLSAEPLEPPYDR